MRPMVAVKKARMAAMCAALLLGVSVSAFAQQPTYEGDIVALDGKANTFTVKGSKAGEVAEMAFHVGAPSEIMINGERILFGELVKGDHVVVSYRSAGATHTVSHVKRVKTVSREMTFAGSVIAVDLKGQIFTVKSTSGSKVEEMTFHFRPGTHLYVGGEEDTLLAQLRPGDAVTVTYESMNAKTHNVKHIMMKTS